MARGRGKKNARSNGKKPKVFTTSQYIGLLNNNGNRKHVPSNEYANRILKLNNVEQVREVANYFRWLKKTDAKNLPKALYEDLDKFSAFEKIFVNHSIQKWSEVSGKNYREDISVDKKFLNENGKIKPKHIKNILENIHSTFDSKLRLNSKYSFAFSNKTYEELIACKKEIIGISIMEYEEQLNEVNNYSQLKYASHTQNRIAINFLLQGEVRSNLLSQTTDDLTVPVAFLATLVLNENDGDRFFALDLLVNGYPQGIKSILRIDNFTILPQHVLDSLNIMPRGNDRILRKYYTNAKHQNLFNKKLPDRQVTELRTSVTNQMHFATATNDLVYCTANYLKHALNIRGKIKLSAMPAKNFDIYQVGKRSFKDALEEMKKDAKEFNGYSPVERLYEAGLRSFNIKVNKPLFNDVFFEKLNLGCNHLVAGKLPEVNAKFHKIVEKLLSQHSNITYVRSTESQPTEEKTIFDNIEKNIENFNELVSINKKALKQSKIEQKEKLQELTTKLKTKTNPNVVIKLKEDIKFVKSLKKEKSKKKAKENKKPKHKDLQIKEEVLLHNNTEYGLSMFK